MNQPRSKEMAAGDRQPTSCSTKQQHKAVEKCIATYIKE